MIGSQDSSLIMGCSFLTRSHALIDISVEELTLRVEVEEIKFKQHHNIEQYERGLEVKLTINGGFGK